MPGLGACGFAVDLVPAGARQVRAIFECADEAERAPVAEPVFFLCGGGGAGGNGASLHRAESGESGGGG